jgi:carbonic anhydrase
MPSLKIKTTARLFLFPFLLMLLIATPALTEEDLPGHLALSRLISGNERFVTGKLRRKDFIHERPTLSQNQHPYAIILACADSRVPPELVFDESLGRLFTVRVAGNVADPAVLGSLEYAVEHLHVRLLMVLGHDSCGAVKATMGGGELPPNIKSLVSRIKPAVDKVWTAGVEEKTRLDAAIRENVHYQMQSALFESGILSEHVHQKDLTVIGGVYHLNTGRVELLPSEVAVEKRFPDEEGMQEADNQADHEAASAKPDDHAEPEVKSPSRPRKSEAKEAHASPAKVSHSVVRKNADTHRNTSEPAKKPVASDKPEKSDHAKSPKKPDHADEHKPRKASFEKTLRSAYENDQRVMLRKSLLMHDSRDGCATADCRSIPAGETVQLENPLLLDVMGRPHLKVRYKGKSVYIAAEETSLAFISR